MHRNLLVEQKSGRARPGGEPADKKNVPDILQPITSISSSSDQISFFVDPAKVGPAAVHPVRRTMPPVRPADLLSRTLDLGRRTLASIAVLASKKALFEACCALSTNFAQHPGNFIS